MEVKEIKTFDDAILAYKKGSLLKSKEDDFYAKIVLLHRFKPKEGEPFINFELRLFGAGIDGADIVNLEELKNEYTIIISLNTYKNKNKMEGYIERMIQEHKELVVRIDKLHAWVYGGAHEKVDAAEFANEAIQLRAMKVYEEALRARLFNAGVNFVDGQYLVSIDNIEDETKDTPDND